MRYYLVAFNPDNDSGEQYAPIGGLDDIIGHSEFSEDLISYITDSSFYADGHIFFIKDDTIYIRAVCRKWEWESFEEGVKLEEYNSLMRLG